MTTSHQLNCSNCEYETDGLGLHWSDPKYQLWKKCPYKSEDHYYSLKEEARLPEAVKIFTSYCGCASHSTIAERNHSLKHLISFAFSYRHTMPEELRKDLSIVDELYHCLKKNTEKQ